MDSQFISDLILAKLVTVIVDILVDATCMVFIYELSTVAIIDKMLG